MNFTDPIGNFALYGPFVLIICIGYERLFDQLNGIITAEYTSTRKSVTITSTFLVTVCRNHTIPSLPNHLAP